MNWTGGRLHRHSHNKRGMLEKIQKQHFAKARVKRKHGRLETPRRMPFSDRNKTDGGGDRGGSWGSLPAESEKRSSIRSHQGMGSNKNPPQEHPLRNVRKHHDTNDEVDSHHTTPDDQNCKIRSSRASSSSPSNNRNYSPENLDELTAIKRKLLQRGDWAALSVTRPLKMEFMPVDQRERVGKRRRMTEEDRSRQAAPVKQVISPEFYRMLTKRRCKRRSETASVLDDISIRIEKPRRRSGSSIVQSKMPSLSQQSSEPMLLDKEEEGYCSQLLSTPSRLPLKSRNTFLNPYTPERAQSLTERLVGGFSASPRLPLIESNNYTPAADECWNPSPLRISSIPSRKRTTKKAFRGFTNGFLGSTPCSIKSQVVPGLETRYRGTEVTSGFGARYFHKYKRPQVQRIYDERKEESITPSQDSERHLATSYPGESASIYQHSSGRGRSQNEADQGAGPPVHATSPVYESIETDDNKGPNFVEDILRPGGESVTIDSMDRLPNQVRVSTIHIPNCQAEKYQQQGTDDNPEYVGGPTIFGQKLNQEAVHVSRKEDPWMRFIFEPRVERGFSQYDKMDTGITRYRRKWRTTDQSGETDSSILEVEQSCDAETSSNLKTTVQTCKNTSLNSSGGSLISCPTNPATVSETDFLSNLSPMEGLLDDGLAHVSVYNNATRSIRSRGTPSRSSSFEWEEDRPNSVRGSQEVWDSQSLSPISESISSAHISTKNQAAVSIENQIVPSPDPLAMDKIYDWDARISAVGGMLSPTQQMVSTQEEISPSGPVI